MVEANEAVDQAAGHVWDARASFEIGILIRRYLEDHPAPPEARFAPDFRHWADSLVADGRARLEELGARQLGAAR
jgi:hypothetical protein